MDNLTTEEKQAIEALLRTNAVLNLFGSDEWNLTEAQEVVLWYLIEKLEASA